MKKKALAAILAIAVGCALAGCGSSSSGSGSSGGTEGATSVEDDSNVTVTDNRHTDEFDDEEETVDESEEASTVEVSDSDFDIKGYKYSTDYGYTCYYLVIKNNSETSVGVEGNGTAKDKDGNTVSASSMSIDVIGPGETSIGYFYFDTEKKVKKVDYTLDYSTDIYYDPVLSDIAVEEAINDDNVIVTATNNGEEAAEYVEAYGLFLDKDGKVVGVDSVYLTDDDSELKPGKSISEQLSVYEDFDDVEVYLTGRHYNY